MNQLFTDAAEIAQKLNENSLLRREIKHFLNEDCLNDLREETLNEIEVDDAADYVEGLKNYDQEKILERINLTVIADLFINSYDEEFGKILPVLFKSKNRERIIESILDSIPKELMGNILCSDKGFDAINDCWKNNSNFKETLIEELGIIEKSS